MSEINQDPESEQEKKKSKIALVIEDPHLQDLISLILIGEDFSIVAFSNQNDAIARMEKEMPDLILCDFHSPGINGLDVCRVLRKNFLFRYIPVIFLMPDAEQLNKAKLVYAGADDYIDKPSVEAEVVLKIRLNLYRVARQQDINPITSLPGEASLIKELEARIHSEKLFSLFYCDLHNFK
ncbi:MAG: response regulator, partial [Candidatus Omnitrophica bacterium]|nr:response regulator [Candidatus Omnitrophota bacterium]